MNRLFAAAAASAALACMVTAQPALADPLPVPEQGAQQSAPIGEAPEPEAQAPAQAALQYWYGEVTASKLEIRKGPGTNYGSWGHFRTLQRIALVCKAERGPVTTKTWFKIAPGNSYVAPNGKEEIWPRRRDGYVSARYVRLEHDAPPTCP